MPPDSTGFQQPETSQTEYNRDAFNFWGLMARVRTATLVEVMGVTTSGADVPAGFVDIRPLVNMVNGNNVAQAHETIYKCPYFRLQAGGNAVILDPQVGDIGFAVFADRDISSVVASQAQANPGSSRMYDMADGIYTGSVLGKENPTQFVQFNADGITVTSPAAVTINAPTATVNAPTTVVNSDNATINATEAATINCATAAIEASVSATITAASIALQNAGSGLMALLNSTFINLFNTHVHKDVMTGSADSGVPTVLAGAAQETSVVRAE